MKLPLWAKDKQGKWRVFPIELFANTEDGYYYLINETPAYKWNELINTFNLDFQYSPAEDRIYLRMPE